MGPRIVALLMESEQQNSLHISNEPWGWEVSGPPKDVVQWLANQDPALSGDASMIVDAIKSQRLPTTATKLIRNEGGLKITQCWWGLELVGDVGSMARAIAGYANQGWNEELIVSVSNTRKTPKMY